jgi:hypothetical protein
MSMPDPGVTNAAADIAAAGANAPVDKVTIRTLAEAFPEEPRE